MKFTIITPSYNRAHLLPQLYYSLKNQTLKDFEWVIIDDGSTDDTKDVVNSFIKDGIININYIFQENCGKQRAYNKGIKAARGELFTCIDSDDYYLPNGLEKIYNLSKEIEYVNYDGEKYNSNEIAGFIYLSIYKNDEIVGSKFPHDREISTMFEMYNNRKVTGDKGITFKTEILKKYSFHVFNGEKFTTEAYLYNKICRDYKLLFINEKIEVKEYQKDGLTDNYEKLLFNNPKGHAMYLNECNYYNMSFINRLLLNANYYKFSKKAGYNFATIYKKSENKLFLLLSLVVVLLKKIKRLMIKLKFIK